MTPESPSIKDKDQLKKLWMEGFGDSERFTDCFFEDCFYPELSSVVKKDGRIIAMAFCHPKSISINGVAFKAAMLAGVLTLPEYRGLGLMHKNVQRLQEVCRKKGITLMINTPAGKNHYASLGHSYITASQRMVLNGGSSVTEYFSYTEELANTLLVYNEMCKRFNCMLIRDENAQALRFKDYSSDSAGFICTRKNGIMESYAAVYELKDKFICPEYAYIDDEANILSALSSLGKPCEVKAFGGRPTAVCKILDMGAFLRRFDLPFAIEVTDGTYPPNNGVFSFDENAHEPALSADAADLITYICGFYDWDMDKIKLYNEIEAKKLMAYFTKKPCFMIEEY